MDQLQQLNTTFLDQYLISYNSELNALNTKSCQSFNSLNDKFYSSIGNNDESMSTFAMNLVKQSNDYVFDKQFVNPYFVQQNTTATLLETINNEDKIQCHIEDDTGGQDSFVNVKRKMKNFMSAQKSVRDHEKEKQFREAIQEYAWLYAPKLISPFIKNFLHQCFVTENVLQNFAKTIVELGQEISLDSYNTSDCLFGFTINYCLNDKQKQHYFNLLFLPGVYGLPKRLNTSYAFNKFMEQFYYKNESILNGSDTILSLFYNTIKFQNVNKSQIVADFVKHCVSSIGEIACDDIIPRLQKIQTLTILFLILKQRYPNLSIKRAERGIVSSITGEYILKENTLYFYERQDLWCLYLEQNNKPMYSKRFLDLFHHLIAISQNE